MGEVSNQDVLPARGGLLHGKFLMWHESRRLAESLVDPDPVICVTLTTEQANEFDGVQGRAMDLRRSQLVPLAEQIEAAYQPADDLGRTMLGLARKMRVLAQ